MRIHAGPPGLCVTGFSAHQTSHVLCIQFFSCSLYLAHPGTLFCAWFAALLTQWLTGIIKVTKYAVTLCGKIFCSGKGESRLLSHCYLLLCLIGSFNVFHRREFKVLRACARWQVRDHEGQYESSSGGHENRENFIQKLLRTNHCWLKDTLWCNFSLLLHQSIDSQRPCDLLHPSN